MSTVYVKKLLRTCLDGAEPRAHPLHEFYKHPEDFEAFIKDLKKNNPDGELSGVLIAPVEQDSHSYALLLLEESIGTVGEKPIYRYHLCTGWDFSYWKARAYLTACIATAWKLHVYVRGDYARANEIGEFSNGEKLLGWNGEGIPRLDGKLWYPEDMALLPENFLKGVDPEQNNFGLHSALALWLELDLQGFMDTGLSKNARPAFQSELSKFEKATIM